MFLFKNCPMNVPISLAELTLTEVISIRNLRFFALASNNGVHNPIKREVSREKLFATDDDDANFFFSHGWKNL